MSEQQKTVATLVAMLDQTSAAEFLGGISPRTLEKWRVQGGGPRYSKLGRSRGRVLYDPRDLAAWLEANKVSNTAEAAVRHHAAA